MADRFYGGDDFEVVDYAFLCMTGAHDPDGLLWGCEADGNILGTFNADEEIIIGCLDAPPFIPAGAWNFLDNGMMLGAFAQICRRK